MRPLFLQFGAGNIGRSLAGALFARAGWDVLFVEAAPELVQALHARRSYRVVVKDDLPPGAPAEILVEHVDGVDARDAAAVTAAVRRADLIGTAVGAAVLPRVLAAMAPGLAQRDRPVSILFCENLHAAAALAQRELVACLPPGFPLAGRVGLVETSIGKMVPLMPAEVRRRDPLEVWGEAYNLIVADRRGFVGTPPTVEGLVLKTNFDAYVARKLYVHNLGHAACACHGFLRGHARIADAMVDPVVATETRAVMQATAAALRVRHPSEFDAASQQAHVDDLLRRFGNRALGDTVFRVGRDLARKLAPGDRFIGGLRLVAGVAGDIHPVCRAIAAALRFAAVDEQGRPLEADTAFRARIAAQGARQVLIDHCGLDPVCDCALLDAIGEARVP
jgi:mannitol-1-phosphate 5-dehydrogenase